MKVSWKSRENPMESNFQQVLKTILMALEDNPNSKPNPNPNLKLYGNPTEIPFKNF